MVAIIIVNGLVSGGVYALLALGFALVFGVARIMNMAHTAFYAVAAFIVYGISVMLGVHYLVGVILGVIVPVIMAAAFYRFVLDRVKQHELAVVILSLALAVLFQEILLVIFGSEFRGIPPFVTGFMEISGVRIAYQQLFALGISIVCLALVWLLLLKTKLGISIRAISQDKEIANLAGINVTKFSMLTVAISIALAGITAVVIAPIQTITPHMWVPPMITVLAAVIIGGVGSFGGAIIGAFVLSFSEVAFTTLVPMGGWLKGTVSLVAMVIVLLIKPEGLFGTVFEEERL